MPSAEMICICKSLILILIMIRSMCFQSWVQGHDHLTKSTRFILWICKRQTSQTPFDTFQFMKGFWLTDPDHENWWTIFPTLNTPQCRPQPAHIIVVNISPFFLFDVWVGSPSLSLCGWNVAYHIVVCKLMSILI